MRTASTAWLLERQDIIDQEDQSFAERGQHPGLERREAECSREQQVQEAQGHNDKCVTLFSEHL